MSAITRDLKVTAEDVNASTEDWEKKVVRFRTISPYIETSNRCRRCSVSIHLPRRAATYLVSFPNLFTLSGLETAALSLAHPGNLRHEQFNVYSDTFRARNLRGGRNEKKSGASGSSPRWQHRR